MCHYKHINVGTYTHISDLHIKPIYIHPPLLFSPTPSYIIYGCYNFFRINFCNVALIYYLFSGEQATAARTTIIDNMYDKIFAATLSASSHAQVTYDDTVTFFCLQLLIYVILCWIFCLFRYSSEVYWCDRKYPQHYYYPTVNVAGSLGIYECLIRLRDLILILQERRVDTETESESEEKDVDVLVRLLILCFSSTSGSICRNGGEIPMQAFLKKTVPRRFNSTRRLRHKRQ